MMYDVKDGLWSPYSVSSAPCLLNYDYVVHMDHTQELEFFMKINNLTISTEDLTKFRFKKFSTYLFIYF